ncbi:MAG: DMT family transporter [Isosphaeraceae bacterium]
MASTARGRYHVLAAAGLWSLSGAVTKSIDLDGQTIAFYRGLFAGLILLPFVPRSRRVFRPWMIPLGLAFGAMTGFFLASMKLTTAANAIDLQYSATFWIVPLGIVFLGEWPDRRERIGIALAMLGIAVIVGFGHGGAGEWRGIAFGLASGVAYACVVVGMRGLRALDPIWLSAVNNLAGTLALGAWMGVATGSVAIPSLPQAFALAAFGVVQMAIPYVLFARGLREVRAPEAGLISLVEPILTPVWVLLVAHERPGLPTLVGGFFLLAGVALRYVNVPPTISPPVPRAQPASDQSRPRVPS